jgi:hypothetical protein
MAARRDRHPGRRADIMNGANISAAAEVRCPGLDWIFRLWVLSKACAGQGGDDGEGSLSPIASIATREAGASDALLIEDRNN